MRTRRNVTSIAVLLAFQGMYLIAGMMSPSKVAAQGLPGEVARRVAGARSFEVSEILAKVITAQPQAAAQIVYQSIQVSPDKSELITASALRVAPQQASVITGAAMRSLAELQASPPPPAPTAQQALTQRQPRSTFNPLLTQRQSQFIFDPDPVIEFGENIRAALCQLLGAFGLEEQEDACVSPSL
jgi:hypothetical protein